MNVSRLMCVAAFLSLAACGGDDDDDDGPDSGGSSTVVVNFSTFDETDVSSFISHLTPSTTSTGSQAFEFGPATPPVGDGSGEWRTGSDGDSGVELLFEV